MNHHSGVINIEPKNSKPNGRKLFPKQAPGAMREPTLLLQNGQSKLIFTLPILLQVDQWQPFY
jgi:hypothetical protein